MHASRVVSAALALIALPAFAQTDDASQPRLRVFQSSHRADLYDEAHRQRALRLVPRLRHDEEAPALPEGAATWNDADARANFEIVRARVVPGDPNASGCCAIRSSEEAGGDPHHDAASTGPRRATPSGKRSRRGSTAQRFASAAATAELQARIVQTNSAGDNVPSSTPRPTGRRRDRRHRGGPRRRRRAATAPSLRQRNEPIARSTSSRAHAARHDQVKLTGPRTTSRSAAHGRRVYVAIREGTGVVDVVDTQALVLAKSIPIRGAVHNTYVTARGRHVIAGSIAGKLTVIDSRPKRSLGSWNSSSACGQWSSRPIAMARRNASFVQLTEFNGFAVIDFATHKELTRIDCRNCRPAGAVLEGGNASHGHGGVLRQHALDRHIA